MNLGDVVEELSGVEDELKTLTNLANRSFDALRDAVLPEERFGVSAASLADLRERLAHGSATSEPFSSIGRSVEQRVLRDAIAEAGKLVRVVKDETGGARLQRFEERLVESLARARAVFEHVGRLELLQERRREAGDRVTALRAPLAGDDPALQLVDLALAARSAADDPATIDARAFIDDAERTAETDGELAGLAANARALRAALTSGAPADAPAADLVDRVVRLALALGREREDALRELARLEQAIERRQDLSHASFEAVTLASEVLEDAEALERRVASGQAGPAALKHVHAACLEQGVTELLLSLREERVEARELDRAIGALSEALGELVATLSRRAEEIRRLAPIWEELALLDPATIEEDAERAAASILGASRDDEGRLRVAPDRLAEMSAADGLAPWRERLLASLGERDGDASVAQRLARGFPVLDELAEEEGETGERARAARERLREVARVARIVGSDYRSRLEKRVLDPRRGLARIEARTAAFDPARDLAPDATDAERRAACLAVLRRVRELFAAVETETLGASSEAATALRADEESTRERMVALRRALALSLARIRRLDIVLFPPPCDAADGAARLGRRIAGGEDVDDSEDDVRERLGEALEALWLEKQFLEHLALPGESEQPVLGDVSRRRARRLLDLSEDSLVLLFELLLRLARDFDALDERERAGHISWIEELLTHARTEVARHEERLERCLLELRDNDTRFDRFTTAFGSYHAWAQAIAESDAGMELVASAGSSLFEQLEEPFARLGAATLERLEGAPADWRSVSSVENVIALLERTTEWLAERPTASDVASSIRARCEAARDLRERVLESASEAMDGGDDGRLVLG